MFLVARGFDLAYRVYEVGKTPQFFCIPINIYLGRCREPNCYLKITDCYVSSCKLSQSFGDFASLIVI